MDKLNATFLKIAHWVIRISLVVILFQQVNVIKKLHSDKYNMDLLDVESAVQASQLSGSYLLEAQGEMAQLIVMAVAAILVELGIYSTFYVKLSRNKKEVELEDKKPLEM